MKTGLHVKCLLRFRYCQKSQSVKKILWTFPNIKFHGNLPSRRRDIFQADGQTLSDMTKPKTMLKHSNNHNHYFYVNTNTNSDISHFSSCTDISWNSFPHDKENLQGWTTSEKRVVFIWQTDIQKQLASDGFIVFHYKATCYERSPRCKKSEAYNTKRQPRTPLLNFIVH